MESGADDGGLTLGSVRTTASHTIGVPHLLELLQILPASASHDEYRSAVIEDNVLGRPTHAGRLRTFRHLREVYGLDPAWEPFRALRRLWASDRESGPVLAGLLAFTRDEMLRASWPAVMRAGIGDVVSSADLTASVAEALPGGLSVASLDKIGRNTGACWTQTGHLVGRARKVRQPVDARPAAVAFAAYLGHLAGLRGARVLETPWAPLLDVAPGARPVALRAAHDAGLLDVQAAGHVVEVGFGFVAGGAR